MVSHRAMTAGSLVEAPAGARLAGSPVTRMNGVGNRITVLDLRGTTLVPTPQEARAIDADPALAFDQLMVIHDAREPGTDAFVSIYNTDGSPAGACGNGFRCVAWTMLRGGPGDTLTLATFAGRVACRRVEAWRVAVDMGAPRFAAADIPTTAADPRAVTLGLDADRRFGPAFALSMGNPHAVFFVDDVETLDLEALGAPVEHAAAFPERTNVSFAQVLDRHSIRLRVWERGAGATLGCGTGACATLVAAAATGRTDRSAAVELPGGTLAIVWGDDDRVIMIGPVELEREGVLDASLHLEPSA